MTDNAVAKLRGILADRSEPLLIHVDEHDCLVAAHITYDSQYSMGLVFRHTEGPVDLGLDPPIRQEFFDQQMEYFPQLTIREKREKIIEEHLDEKSVPTIDADFRNWLSQQIGNELIERWSELADETLSEGTPGFLILESLSEADASKLRMRKVVPQGQASR